MDPTNAFSAHASSSPEPGTPPHGGPRPVPEPSQPPAPYLAPPLAHETAVTHSMVAASGEQCPSCGVHVAPDQRYCLHCGARCGEPRLPFMNAVTFMDAMKPRPDAAAASAPPKRPQRRLSPNAALIATIGTLLLAMGVGVLIGRSGNHTVASTPAAPQVIKVGGGGEEETATASGAGAGAEKGGSAKKQPKKVLKNEAESQSGAEEYLPESNVPLAKPTQKLGGSCEKGTAGCSKNGKFEGNFFGEE